MEEAIKRGDVSTFKGIVWAIPKEVYETEEWRSIMANALLTVTKSQMFKEIVDRGYPSQPTGFGIEHKVLMQAHQDKRLDLTKILLSSSHWKRIRENLQASLPNPDYIYNALADSLALAGATKHNSFNTLLQELPRSLDSVKGITAIMNALKAYFGVDPTTMEKLIALTDIIRGGEHRKLETKLRKTMAGAIERGRGDAVLKVLTSKIISNRRGTLLLKAAKAQHERIVETILEDGVNTDSYDPEVLIAAAENGSMGILKMLMDARKVGYHQDGFNDSRFDHTLGICLNKACVDRYRYKNHLPVVEYLLSIGAPLTSEQLINALRSKRSMDIMEALVNAGINLNFIGRQALVIAANQRNMPMIKLLLENGVSPDCFNGYVVKYAAESMKKSECTTIIEMFINAGANVNIAMPEVLTSICCRGIIESFYLILKHIDVSTIDGPKLLDAMLKYKDYWQYPEAWNAPRDEKSIWRLRNEMLQRLLALGLDLSTHQDINSLVKQLSFRTVRYKLPIETLIQLGLINDRKYLNMMLHMALLDGPEYLAVYLLGSGADITSEEATKAF
ncbi:hypothetical protein HDU76_008329 [Blyttiomyces sp. JEL0837]|nr:hypothetical protein HDU76_008329 [Blyttiomyces sp. JEL0837]